ncbi:hypothetical protein BC826DRAFT_971465 [Russula brevipes]|nr:hypothetical protein BC826DRAFT_971465 [Russula brevipes]
MPGNWGRRTSFVQRKCSAQYLRERLTTHGVVTIDILPDEVLLEIFDIIISYDHIYRWHTLVHVCRRWRSVVFASAHRLELRLLCTSKTPVRKTLDVWPALPIIVEDYGNQLWGLNASNIIAAFEHRSRICRIHLSSIPNSVLKQLSAAMKDPFPALIHLWLSPDSDSEMVPVLPDSFLGGSAPHLESLWLLGVPFPAVPKLILSASDLGELCLLDIPHSGYISPEAMATILSALTGLIILSIGFKSPRSRPDRPSPPRSTRTVLPALTYFKFTGVSEYLEVLISHIDAPLLDNFDIKFFNQLIFNTPLLCSFISHAEKLRSPSGARIAFINGSIMISLAEADCSSLSLKILCQASDRQLPSLTQVCNSPFLSLFNLEHLEICDRLFLRPGPQWLNAENTQWLELLRQFTTVKSLSLSKLLVPCVVPALQELSGERIMDALPALRSIFLPESLLLPVKVALTQFLTARQLSGHPVAVNPLGQE